MTNNEELPDLTITVIEELKRKGMTQSEIARLYGVTRQAVSWHKHTYNGTLTPREQTKQHFPWKGISQEQQRCSAYRRLRDHGEYMATGGKGMDILKLKRLKSFYKKQREGWVLEYDPDIPPIDGFASKGGFALRRRLPKDGDLLIRVNKYTELTDKGRLLWRLPEVDPQI